MSEIDDILNNFEYIGQQKRIISLVNSYKGVTISLDVSIDQVIRRRGEIIVSTHHGQNISLLPATKILIHADLFPKPIQATVGSVDVHHRTAVLKNFLYPVDMREARKEARVQPKSELPINVVFRDQNERLASILDISVEGISVRLNDRSKSITQTFVPKTSVRLNLSLPIPSQADGINLSFPAVVTYIHPLNSADDFRVGFMTFPNEQDKNLLRRFIFDRQTELFNEVGQHALTKKRSTLIS